MSTDPNMRVAPALTIGSRVVNVRSIGVLRARVPAGTAGVIAGQTPDGEFEVHFDNGRVELVQPWGLHVGDPR